MPMLRYNPGAGNYVWDSWGGIARNDWVPVPGRTGFYQISGESPNPNEGEYGGPFYSSAAAAAAANPRPAGPTQSELAYNASLAAQGISPAELPYGQVGQIATARVQSQHGLPIASWLQPFLAKALAAPAPVAGTNVTAPATAPPFIDQGANFNSAAAANIAPDFFAPLANATNPLTQLRNAELAATSAASKQTSVYSQLRNAILQRFGVAPTTIARPY